MFKSLIVVPCYNEERRLPVDQFVDFLNAFQSDVHFLFVDDGSKDNTVTVLQRLADSFPDRVEILELAKNGGKAEAVRRGILHSIDKDGYAFIGFWDADLATPLGEINDFVELLNERDDIDMVVGARVKLMGRDICRKPLRHYLGRVFATAASAVLGISIYDTQCGAKIFRNNDLLRRGLEEPFSSKWIFDVELLARYRQLLAQTGSCDLEKKIYEYPLRTWHDIAGSKVKPSDFILAFNELLQIYFRYKKAFSSAKRKKLLSQNYSVTKSL